MLRTVNSQQSPTNPSVTAIHRPPWLATSGTVLPDLHLEQTEKRPPRQSPASWHLCSRVELVHREIAFNESFFLSSWDGVAVARRDRRRLVS